MLPGVDRCKGRGNAHDRRTEIIDQPERTEKNFRQDIQRGNHVNGTEGNEPPCDERHDDLAKLALGQRQQDHEGDDDQAAEQSP